MAKSPALLLTASVNLDIGNAFDGMVSMWTVGVQGLSTSTITPQAVVIDSLDTTTAMTYVACYYKKDSDGSTVAAGVNITADGIYLIPSHGKLIRLAFTFVAGTPSIWWKPSAGSA